MFDLSEQKDPNQRVKELGAELEKLDADVKGFFEELGISPEQIHTFVKDQDNFSEKNWEDLQKERQKLEQRLKREVENIPNLKERRRAWQERNVAPDWLFVK